MTEETAQRFTAALRKLAEAVSALHTEMRLASHTDEQSAFDLVADLTRA